MPKLLLVSCLSASVLAGLAGWHSPAVNGASIHRDPDATWNKAAAAYMDTRETWWQNWPKAQRDHGTVCVSCHTVLPYALARPTLSRDLKETSTAGPEKVMLDNIEKREAGWSEMIPFYNEKSGPGKTEQSHATEAVVNAIILTDYDTRQGHLRPITLTALNHAWELQLTSGEDAGGWIWQDFHLAPWESADSAYQLTALLALKVGAAPDNYAKKSEVLAHMKQLNGYLKRKYSNEPFMNQLYVLWASNKVAGLLTSNQRTALLARLTETQQPDGGWMLQAMDNGWKRKDGTELPAESDGFATSLAVLVMEQTGFKSNNASLKRGLEWLRHNQQSEGSWNSVSMNKKRDPATDAARFMSDAATGYAVLALEGAN